MKAGELRKFLPLVADDYELYFVKNHEYIKDKETRINAINIDYDNKKIMFAKVD